LADEIAYDTADLDDGYEAHLLHLHEICGGVPVFTTLLGEVNPAFPHAPEKLRFNETLKRMLNGFVDDLIRNTEKNIREAKIGSVEDVRRHPRRLLSFSAEVEKERGTTKEFLYAKLYFSATLQPEKEDAERVIRDLFGFWMAHPDSLPAAYQEKARREPLARVVCDYIAGMTDNYIYEQYEKHGPRIRTAS
jgi:dGTPase